MQAQPSNIVGKIQKLQVAAEVLNFHINFSSTPFWFFRDKDDNYALE